MPFDPTPAPAGGRRFLRCPTCGRADEVTESDLLRHANGRWPKCCGQVMDYVVGSGANCPTCGRAGGLTFPAVAPAGAPVQIVCLLCALSSDAETKS
jgi:hypothetical protein